MSIRARPVFAVRQHKDKQFWICIEEGPSKSALANGTYGFEWEPGKSREKAEEIARYMGENIEYFVKH